MTVPTTRWWRSLEVDGKTSITDVTPAPVGGIYVGATGWTPHGLGGRRGSATGWVGHVEEDGTVDWERPVDDREQQVTALAAVEAGIVVAGTCTTTEEGEAWLAGLDERGEHRWREHYPSGVADEFDSVVELPDGTGFCAGGRTGSYAKRDWESVYGSTGWVVAVDRDGSEHWQRSVAGDRCREVCVAADGSLRYVGGAFAGALEADGTERWSTVVGARGDTGRFESGTTIGERFVVVGSGPRRVGDDGRVARVIEIGADGTVVTETEFTVGGGTTCVAKAATASDRGGLLVAGVTLVDGQPSRHSHHVPWLVCLDDDLTLEWEYVFDRGSDGRPRIVEPTRAVGEIEPETQRSEDDTGRPGANTEAETAMAAGTSGGLPLEAVANGVVLSADGAFVVLDDVDGTGDWLGAIAITDGSVRRDGGLERCDGDSESTDDERRAARLDQLMRSAREGRLDGHVGYDLRIVGESDTLDAFLAVFGDEFVVERTDSATELRIPSDENEGALEEDGRSRIGIVELIHETLGAAVFRGSWFTAIGRS